MSSKRGFIVRRHAADPTAEASNSWLHPTLGCLARVSCQVVIQTRSDFAMDAVDQFVKHKVLPEFHDIVTMLRELMRECAPHATEQVSYGIPMWKGKGYLAWISPTRRDITFGFTYVRGGA
jgi:hypothetical protein